jgi:hypothetical protein
LGAAAVLLIGGGVTWLVWPAGTTPATASTSACPDRAPGKPIRSLAPDLAKQLVPGNPQTALVCRYHGLNLPEPAGTLAQTATVRRGVADLATALNQGQPVDKSAMYNCPVDSGESMLITFTYPAGRTVVIQLHTRGCHIATNGTSAVFTSPDAGQRLMDLVGADPN